MVGNSNFSASKAVENDDHFGLPEKNLPQDTIESNEDFKSTETTESLKTNMNECSSVEKIDSTENKFPDASENMVKIVFLLLYFLPVFKG